MLKPPHYLGEKEVQELTSDSPTLFENRIESLVALNHHVFNEQEAAFYCRCSKASIRYHALRSRKLTFCDFSKESLIFLKDDLDIFLRSTRKQCV